VQTAGVASSSGADLYFERWGEGPPLLLIAGGGGDCGYYWGLAAILAAQFTVVMYDRRGNSRSPLHGPERRIVIAEQSADAIAVLRANGFESARVFGNSGGATIALDLAAHHPYAVEAMVAHEPPVPKVLPDPAAILAQFDEVDRIREYQGWKPAFIQFQQAIGGLEAGDTESLAFFFDPATVIASGPQLDVMTRLSRNWEYLTKYEIDSFIDYAPDLDAIVRNKVPAALAYGAETRDPMARDVCTVIAERLSVECVQFPGGHTAPAEMPEAFAPSLVALFERLLSED
jgi:pimeloyl-ACP methyl ester carboxylesterase